ncbi:membrane protein [Thermobispora bispora]|uniref:DUF2752 domain-containing protein n=2 Tax=Thermobispora bispora TaxID=2006 RepID=D6YA24_THEBD|nr:conserved hypothetical protein [Thermobispora bispora DSM 43833]
MPRGADPAGRLVTVPRRSRLNGMRTAGRGGGRARRMLLPLGTGACAAIAVACVAAVDPHRAGRLPLCPFFLLTGWYCPACGGLRAVHDLAHGDLAGALDMNPLVVAGAPVVLGIWARWTLRSWRGRPAREPFAHPILVLAAVAVVLVFWVARNTFVGRFLAP